MALVRIDRMWRPFHLLVEWVIRVRLEHDVLEPEDNTLHVEHGLPVLPQDIEAHMAFHVDVRVINCGFAQDLGSVVWVRLRHFDVECEFALMVDAVLRLDVNPEVHQVLRAVVEVDLNAVLFGIKLELTSICEQANRPIRASQPETAANSVHRRGVRVVPSTTVMAADGLRGPPFCMRSKPGATFFSPAALDAASASFSCLRLNSLIIRALSTT